MFAYCRIGMVGLLVILFGCIEVFGFTTPCQWKYPRSLQRAVGEIDTSHCTILGIMIGGHTLQDVRDKLGNADIFRRKISGVKPTFICYTVDKNSIIFGAGPLGGWATITEFVVAPYSLIPCYSNECKNFQSTESISTTSGITLGMDKKEFIQILGKPTHSNSDMLAYHYLCERKMTEDEIRKAEKTFKSKVKSPTWSVSSGIEAYFSNEKLSWFRVYKTVSY